MSARVVAMAGVLAMLAASTLFLFADSYAGSSCTTTDGVRECTEGSSTLMEKNGRGVLAILAIPVVLAGAVATLVWLRGPRKLAIALAVLLLLACMVAAASVGLFFVPGAVLALVAVALDASRRPRGSGAG